MLQWVWSKRIDDEGNDPRRVILIMTYRSWARKTLMTKEENDKVTYSSSFASQSRDFEVLICDEAHRLKERSTVSFKAVSLITASRVLLLTATPCLNDPKVCLQPPPCFTPAHCLISNSFRIIWHLPKSFGLAGNKSSTKRSETSFPSWRRRGTDSSQIPSSPSVKMRTLTEFCEVSLRSPR